jgi:hypothetical protein
LVYAYDSSGISRMRINFPQIPNSLKCESCNSFPELCNALFAVGPTFASQQIRLYRQKTT